MKLINNSILFLLALILCSPIQIKAHEEPAKTLKEKNQKEAERKKIKDSKIKSLVLYTIIYNDKQQIEKKEKTFVMKYNEHGNFISVEAYKNDSLNLTVSYEYDGNDNIISDIDYSPQGLPLEKNLYTFDMQGRVVSGKSFIKEDSLEGRFVIEKSNNKKKLDFIKYKADNSTDYKITYAYDDDFDKTDYTEAVKYNSDGTINIKVTKKYNDNFRQTEKAVYDGSGNKLYFFTYEYDKSGNNVKISKSKPDGTIDWSDNYSFDKHGNCTGMKSFDSKNMPVTELIYDYEYFK
ncbi:MAG TPA: hypothetical protein PLI16_02005 [Bacteroidales bacterium]|jgi:hypothetical protein|nr:hypothetical protein [Bacteroidales bacterium]HNZ42992.1 hypothetical protein [Bacteroidales bacterium]HOH83363.1 hypothetical protein [Bacteroidales bacterium]HPB25679.1 hypothetical protein [Bacteroidales bacterium]HPI30336.1 hypothetical protein [Bacteroidales bacterium]